MSAPSQALLMVTGPPAVMWNPLDKGTNVVLSNSNLTMTSASHASAGVRANASHQKGSYYFEVLLNTLDTGGNSPGSGIYSSFAPLLDGVWWGTTRGGSAYPAPTLYTNSGSPISLGVPCSVNDVIGVAFNCDTGQIWWARNGTWTLSGNPAAGTGAPLTFTNHVSWFPGVAGLGSVTARFAPAAWSYAAPSGFLDWGQPELAATWDPLDKVGNGTLSNRNLTGSAGQVVVRATVRNNVGKYYWEVLLDSGANSSDPFVGIKPVQNPHGSGGPFGSGGDLGIFSRSPNTGHQPYIIGSNIGFGIAPPIAAGDRYIFAVDLGALRFWTGRNGVWDSGDPAVGSGGVALPAGMWSPWLQTNLTTTSGRFDHTSWAYTAPTGFTEWVSADPIWSLTDKSPDIGYSNGNLSVTYAPQPSGSSGGARGSIGHCAGKYYFEFKLDLVDTGSNTPTFGIAKSTWVLGPNCNPGSAGSIALLTNGFSGDGSGSTNKFVGSLNTGDVAMLAVNLGPGTGAGNIWFGKNGTWFSGDPAANTSPTWTTASGTFFPSCQVLGTFPPLGTARFIPASWSYMPPAGFYPW